MMLQSNSDTDGTESEDTHVTDHISFCTHRIVSEIIGQILKDLPVLGLVSPMQEGSNFKERIDEKNERLCEILPSSMTDMGLLDDGNSFQCNKPVEEEGVKDTNISTKAALVDTSLPYINPDSVNNNQEMSSEIDKDVINNCGKEKLLFALRLSPVPDAISKEPDFEDKVFTEKKKESVHFNSPVAAIYEFSERSECVSKGSTAVLSDSDSEDFPLSQTKYTDNLESQNEETNWKTESDISSLLNISETRLSVEGRMKNCILTPGGDCFNSRLSENVDVTWEQFREQKEITDNDNRNDNNQSRVSASNGNCNVRLTEENESYEKEKTDISVISHKRDVTERISFCTHHIVSEIIGQILEDLPVFGLVSPMQEGSNYKERIKEKNERLCEILPSSRVDMRLLDNGNSFQCNKPVKEEGVKDTNLSTRAALDDTVLPCINPDSVNNNQEVESEIDKDVINSFGKEKLLFALRLSPVPDGISKEPDFEDKVFTEKKKESVHFNSPVAVIYEFSERSECVSEGSTDILSDSDSEDFPLSQTKYTDNLEQNEETNWKNESDINSLLNICETSVEGCMKDCILTPGGDCFNSRLSENVDVTSEQIREQKEKTDNDNRNDNNQSRLSANNGNFNVRLTEENESYEKEKTDISVNSHKRDVESSQSMDNIKSCLPTAAGDNNSIMLDDFKPEDNNPSNQETKKICKKTSEDICYSERKLQDKESYKDRNFIEDTNSYTDSYNNSLVLPSLGEGDCIENKLDNLPPIESKCAKHDKDISEIFTKFPLAEKEDAADCSQDLFIDLGQKNSTELECAKESEKKLSPKWQWSDNKKYVEMLSNKKMDIGIGNSQQDVIQKISVLYNENNDRSEEFMNIAVEHEVIQNSQENVSIVSDVEDSKEDTENVLLGFRKREQTSPELHCSQISKKIKPEEDENVTESKRKRKLFKVGLDGHGNVKLLKLDNDLKSDSASGNKAEPKLLKRLASDAIALLDETVIWDSTKKEEVVNKQKDGINAHEEISVQCYISDTEGISNGCTDMVILNKKCKDQIPENRDRVIEGKLFYTEHAEKLQLVEFEAEEPCKLENYQSEALQIETSEVYDKSQGEEHLIHSQSIIKSPGFKSAAELLSQSSSQDSGSTGFTVNAGDFYCSQDECERNNSDDSEVWHIDSAGEVVQENNPTSKKIEHFKEEFEHEGVTTQTYKSKSVVEITEDGLEEEKLEHADHNGIISSSEQNRNVELAGCSHRSLAALDQDEQIDTEELDMYVDRAVDQIVPDKCAEIEDGSINTDTEQAMCRKNGGEKQKLYVCDLDLGDEQDDPVCKPVNRSGKPYEKCFSWKYRPSCDFDSDSHLPELPDEDHVVTITPLKTCGKPLRLGLSKMQPVRNSLHKLGMKK